mmetsp:Transcript_22453/g.28680  ORF Transcript_22453/g.28680 Transcript_22453/m.28680 type:complete len:256 (-) Transcript_22453:48-815(-)
MKGNFELFKLLLASQKVNSNTQMRHQNTILHHLCKSNIQRVDHFIDFLLEHSDADVNATNNLRDTPLIVGAKCGNASALERLLKVPNINVNFKNKEGHTAIFYTTGNIDLFNLFYNDKRCSVDVKGESKNTMLHYAVSDIDPPSYDVIATLIADERIDINAKNDDNETALKIVYKAFQQKFKNDEKFLEVFCEADELDDELAESCVGSNSYSSANLPLAVALCKRGADPQSFNLNGKKKAELMDRLKVLRSKAVA